MTLEEAIKHCEKVAKAKEREAKINRNHGGWAYDDEATKCSACAAEHRQLAEWLKELKKYREWLGSFNPDSATECFTAVRELRSFVGRGINIPTTARAEGSEG